MLPAYATFNPVSVDEQVWYPNSSAVSNMTFEDGNLFSKIVYSGNTMVKVGDVTLIPVAHTSASIPPTRHKPLTRKNVLPIPKLQHNLLSVRQLDRDNGSRVFDSSCVCVKNNTIHDVLL